MLERKFFHLDCHPMIPECGFRCADSIDEIGRSLKGIAGVSEVSLGKHGETLGIVVGFDSEKIGIQELLSALGRLPSAYRGCFVPTLIEDWREGSA